MPIFLNTVESDKSLWSLETGSFSDKCEKIAFDKPMLPSAFSKSIGLSNAIFSHLSEKLPVSRLQRDLSDSTVLRNIGTAYGYMEIAINSTLKGLSKLEANKEAISSDLEERYELLTEALQSFLRLEGKKDGYDQVKLLSRGQKMDKEMYLKAVEELIENSEYKKILMDLTPSKYIGLAAKLAEMK